MSDIYLPVRKLSMVIRSLGYVLEVAGSIDYDPPFFRIPMSMENLWNPNPVQALFLSREISHELGHWFVASDEEKRLKNFGLDGLPKAQWQEERELQARIVESYLLSKLGLDGALLKDRQINEKRFSPEVLANGRKWELKIGSIVKSRIDGLMDMEIHEE